MAKKRFNVLSPDGFSIHFSDTYKTKEEAIVQQMFVSFRKTFTRSKSSSEALENWVKRYEIQGYYSSVNYGRIPLDELPNYCEIVEI